MSGCPAATTDGLLVFETDLTQVWGVPQPLAGQVPDGAAVVRSAVRRLGRGALPGLRAGPPRRPLVPLAVAGGGFADVLGWFALFVLPVLIVLVKWAAARMAAGPLDGRFWYGRFWYGLL